MNGYDYYYQFVVPIKVYGCPIKYMVCDTICLINVEYHANENPLKNSGKNSICWSKINLSNNQKRIIF